MRPTIKINGVGHVKTMLRNIAHRVPDIARGQMKRSAARVVKLAKIMVPEDEGLLRDSIRIEKTYGDRGRLQIDVIAGNAMAVKASGRQINLDQYALLVHEAYETSVASKGPGPRTREKMAQHPNIKIGSGFLFRAMQTEDESFTRVMVQIINNVIKREGG